MQPGYCISQPEIRVYSAETIKILQTARIAEEIEPTALPDLGLPVVERRCEARALRVDQYFAPPGGPAKKT